MGNGSLWEWEETRFLPTRVGYKGPVYDPVNFLSEFAVPGSPGISAARSRPRFVGLAARVVDLTPEGLYTP